MKFKELLMQERRQISLEQLFQDAVEHYRGLGLDEARAKQFARTAQHTERCDREELARMSKKYGPRPSPDEALERILKSTNY